MHTPSPWTAEATRGGKTFEVYFGDAEAGESGAGWCTLSGANQADNARLIAAAPDLLAALREFANQFHKGDGDCTPAQLRAKHAARTALNKALGE